MHTSKTILIIIFLGLSHFCLGQITYQPVFMHQVTNEVDTFYSHFAILQKDSINYYVNSYKDKYPSFEIVIPDTGLYHLTAFPDNFGDVYITKSGSIDTFYLRLILEFDDIGSAPTTYHYSYDEKPCNGNVIDYFYNGNIRAKGTFEDGLPTGDLKYYYKNGQLEEHHIHQKDIRIRYFENGTIKEYSNFKKSKYKEYYENGQLKSLRVYRKIFAIQKTFYESGQLKLNLKKNTEIYYYKKGQLKSKLKKNTKIYYNEKGQVITKVRRHEILVFDRIIDNIKGGYEQKFYEYKWTNYDKNRNRLIQYIYLTGDTYNAFNEIDDKLFEVFLYHKNKAVIKIKEDFEIIDNESKYFYQIYHIQNKKWIKGEKIEKEELFPTIEQLQRELNNQ